MRWTRKLLFLAIIWSVALLAMLAVTEIVLRLTDDGWGQTLRMNIIRGRSYDFDVSRLYDTNRPTVRYTRNQWGLRDDCGAPDRIDILTVGGSTTDQRYVPFADTWQKVMEVKLSRQLGRRICVSNAGVDGQSSFGHELAFRHWFPLIPGLKPKVIIFYIGINDADYTLERPSHFDLDETGGKRSWLRQLYISRIWYWASDTLGGLLRRRTSNLGHQRERFVLGDYPAVTMHPDTPQRSVRHAEEFRQRLRMLLAQARKLGAQPLCVTQPHHLVKSFGGRQRGVSEAMGWPDEIRNGLDYDFSIRRIYAVMAEECGRDRLLDLYAQPISDTLYYDFMHTKPAGAHVIGTRMAERMGQPDFAAILAGTPR